MPDAFTDLVRITRSHIPAANTSTKMDVPNVRWTALLEAMDANIGDPHTLAASQSSALTLKCGRLLGSNDSHPQKRKPMAQGPKEPTVNPTIAYSYYASLDDVWRRNEMIVDDALAFAVATEIMLSDGIKWRSVDECWRRTNWSSWKQAIQVELDSLTKCKVFGPVAHIPPHMKPIGRKWVFVRKCNEKNKIVQYKTRRVAQGFSQCPGIDYENLFTRYGGDYFSLPYQFGRFRKTGYAADGRSNNVSLWGSWYENLYESSWRTYIDWFKYF